MSERTLIFHRATLPDDTVLLPVPDASLTVDAVARNADGAITGQHVRELDPWLITSFALGLGAGTGQTNYRHLELTVTRNPGGDLPATETVELARNGELALTGVQVNQDGHRTQPYLYRIPVRGLESIELGEYVLRPPKAAPHTVLGSIVGKHPVYDSAGLLGYIPVYDEIKIPETAAV